MKYAIIVKDTSVPYLAVKLISDHIFDDKNEAFMILRLEEEERETNGFVVYDAVYNEIKKNQSQQQTDGERIDDYLYVEEEALSQDVFITITPNHCGAGFIGDDSAMFALAHIFYQCINLWCKNDVHIRVYSSMNDEDANTDEMKPFIDETLAQEAWERCVRHHRYASPESWGQPKIYL